MSDSPSSPSFKSTSSSYKFDAKRWSKNDRSIAIASFVFFISLFLPWFGIRVAVYGANVDGLWHGYMYLTLILSLVTVIYLLLRAGMETLPFSIPMKHEQALAIATGVDFVLALISFLTKPSGTSWQYGAYIGLIASAFAVAPFAIPAVRARMAK